MAKQHCIRCGKFVKAGELYCKYCKESEKSISSKQIENVNPFTDTSVTGEMKYCDETEDTIRKMTLQETKAHLTSSIKNAIVELKPWFESYETIPNSFQVLHNYFDTLLIILEDDIANTIIQEFGIALKAKTMYYNIIISGSMLFPLISIVTDEGYPLTLLQLVKMIYGESVENSEPAFSEDMHTIANATNAPNIYDEFCRSIYSFIDSDLKETVKYIISRR